MNGKDLILCVLTVACLGLYAAFIDARSDYLLERRHADTLVDTVSKLELRIEAQDKKMVKHRIGYRSLP